MNLRALPLPAALPAASARGGVRRVLASAVGLAVVAVAAVVLVHALRHHDTRLLQALNGGLIAAAATAIGTLPALFGQRLSQRASDCMLGFGAGVMLAATSFSLVIPALAAAAAQGHGAWGSGLLVGAGVAMGALLLLLLGRRRPLPGPHDQAEQRRAVQRAWVFVAAISLHNIPEGWAIGVAYGGAAAGHAQALATGIAVQDIPEGLVVALALRTVGYGRVLSVALGMASGLVEPIAALIGAAAITWSVALLPWGLAFAAGAMLFAVSHEAIPGSQQHGNDGFATSALVLGFVLMTLLDTALSGAPTG